VRSDELQLLLEQHRDINTLPHVRVAPHQMSQRRRCLIWVRGNDSKQKNDCSSIPKPRHYTYGFSTPAGACLLMRSMKDQKGARIPDEANQFVVDPSPGQCCWRELPMVDRKARQSHKNTYHWCPTIALIWLLLLPLLAKNKDSCCVDSLSISMGQFVVCSLQAAWARGIFNMARNLTLR
jgi:hypothetical protein